MAELSADVAHQPTAACIVEASKAHGVDPQTVARELVLRNGQRGMIYSTPDGGFEVGLMRIPSAALPALKARGVTQNDLAWNNCLNIQVATEMLRVRIDQQGRLAAQATFPTPPATTALRMLPAPEDASRAITANAGTRQQCVSAASQRYGVHPQLIQAVMRTEGGTTGKISRNTNGSYDMGLMQINSIHLPELAKMGITRDQVINDECTNIFVGTYKLRQAIDGGADFWTGVARYHSKTPSKARKYLARVAKHLREIVAGSVVGSAR